MLWKLWTHTSEIFWGITCLESAICCQLAGALPFLQVGKVHLPRCSEPVTDYNRDISSLMFLPNTRLLNRELSWSPLGRPGHSQELHGSLTLFPPCLHRCLACIRACKPILFAPIVSSSTYTTLTCTSMFQVRKWS